MHSAIQATKVHRYHSSYAPLLQRAPLSRLSKISQDEQAPPIVHAVLRGPGLSMAESQRAHLETRFRHDFSQVRLHLDHQAARSARAVDALAYTVGRHIVFGEGQFAPGTLAGQRLLAHELTHVVQQAAHPASLPRRLPLGPLNNSHEEQAERNAASLAQGFNLPGLITRSLAVQRNGGTTPSKFPGFSQGDYVTCGAASLVSAMVIWDKEKSDPAAPNEMVVSVCNLALSHLAWQRTALIQAWKDRKVDGNALYDEIKTNLSTIRDAARLPGSKLTEEQYQAIALAFYALHYDGKPGLSKEEIWKLTKIFGLSTSASDQATTYDDIFSSTTLTGLKPGQVAQVHWWVKTGKPDETGSAPLGKHAFLIGRFKDGKWFLSDQGPKPPAEYQANDLPGLKGVVFAAAGAGLYWIHTGGPPVYNTPAGPAMVLTPGFTGVVLLGKRGDVEKEAVKGILKPGETLGEVDAGYTVTGETLTSWDFLERQYSLVDARTAFGRHPGAHGGLIVEMPEVVFNLYKTNLLKNDKNLDVDKLDESEGGLLVGKKIHYHAWLILCTANACKAGLLKVY